MSSPLTRLGRGWRAAAAAGAAVVALNLVLFAVRETTQNRGGPSSSSYATAPEGLAAYADLLARSGHPVVRARDPLGEMRLDPSTTVVLLDADAVSREEARDLRRFAERGGRLIAGQTRPAGWMDELLDEPPEWSPRGGVRAAPIAPVPEVAGVRSVQSAAAGSWRDAGEALPALAAKSSTVLAVATPGRGRVALLADTSLLQNRFLGSLDNAALGVALAGERRRSVVFVESVHGYGEASGLAAVPPEWRWTLAGLVAAALMLMWARGRRLGPPEPGGRELPPPRKEYVESLAGVLARTRRPDEATERLRAAVRERVARRAGVEQGGDVEALRRAAARLGLSQDDVDAVFGGQGDLLAAARALARIERGATGGRAREART